MNKIETAIRIAVDAHQGQVDKAGKPYILHPLRVMLEGYDEDRMIVGVLHDVIEDSDVTIDGLRGYQFSEEILAALDAMTKRAGETYENYLVRLAKNDIAIEVKLADLTDNMDTTRLHAPISLKDRMRLAKYHEARKFLLNVLEDGLDNCLLEHTEGEK